MNRYFLEFFELILMLWEWYIAMLGPFFMLGES